MSVQAEQKVRRMSEEWVEALINKDISTLKRLMDQGCIFTDTLAGDDQAQFIADVESGDLQVHSLKRENVEVGIYGSTGILTALDTAEWQYKGQPIQRHYRIMTVYAEREGIWQIVAIHASPIEVR
jgi:ketosteroid isomerase-like protein